MRLLTGGWRVWLAVALLACCSAPAFAQDSLPPALAARIDTLARTALAQSGAPSASIAVVRGGKLAYARAYGNAQLDPATPATPAMRYAIGSVSKQFTAAAILLLQQQGRLSLDDKVAKYFPQLTDAGHVTLRQLLSHTSGYQDYWPQDYVLPMMRQPTTPAYIMDTWAAKPLDFAPGSSWQYSNTGYTIAGAIVAKLTGQTPFQFLQQHVFAPLGMASAWDVNLAPLPEQDATGHFRYALGPLRPAPYAGANWLYGMGELGMTASDLAKWDIAMLDRTLLSPASWRAMQTNVALTGGAHTGYGLGVFVGKLGGHRVIYHDGEVPGFTARNYVFPDDDAAVVVLVNQDAVGIAGSIGHGIARAVLGLPTAAKATAPAWWSWTGLRQWAAGLLRRWRDPGAATALAQARQLFAGLQRGQLQRAWLTPDANGYFNAAAMHDYQASLAPLGQPISFTPTYAMTRGGMQMRGYRVVFAHRVLTVDACILPNGKFDQYMVTPGG